MIPKIPPPSLFFFTILKCVFIVPYLMELFAITSYVLAVDSVAMAQSELRREGKV